MSSVLARPCPFSMNNGFQKKKTLIDLPTEVLQLVLETVWRNGLWALYYTSQTMRVHATRPLFWETIITLQRDFPMILNNRRLPVRTIFDILRREMSHIQFLYLYPSSQESALILLDLLGRMPNLKCCIIESGKDDGIIQPTMFPFLRYYAPELGSCLWPSCSFQSLKNLIICATSDWTIPSLPALQSLSINYENSSRSSISVDLTELPQLLSFELEEYQGEGLRILGPSRTLQKVTIMLSYLRLSLLQNLGQNIEQVDVSLSIIYPSGQHPRVQLPHLKSLTLYDSISFLPFLFPTNVSSLEELSITTGSEDEWYGYLLKIFNLPEGTTELTKYDGSLAKFASRVTQFVENIEWPTDHKLWIGQKSWEGE